MIRLIRTALLPIPPLRPILRLPFSNHKKKSWLKKIKSDSKNQRLEDADLNQDDINEGKQHSEVSEFEIGNRLQKKIQKRSYSPPSKYAWDIPNLIHPDWLESLKSSFSTANKLDFQAEWSRICSIKEKNLGKKLAIFQFSAILMARLLEIKAPVLQQLAAAIMKGFFCMPFSMLPPNHYTYDFTAVQFLTAHQPQIEISFKKATLMQQLRFYNYYKDLTVRRAGQPKFRQLTSQYYFIYKSLQEEAQKVDFASETGQEPLNLFRIIVRTFPLNSEDSKIINGICSQVPFFSEDSLILFMTNNLQFLLRAEPAAILSILQAAKLYGFANMHISTYEPLLSVLVSLYGKVPEVATEIEEILGLLTVSLFKNNRTHIYGLLIELSKHIELRPNSPAATHLFAYMQDKIKLLAFMPNHEVQHEVKLQFQFLSCILNNKLVRRSNFEGQLRDLQEKLENVMSRRKEVDGKYLLRLLKGGDEKVEMFNGVLLLELSPKKKVEYIRQILQQDDLEFAKSLMHVLVNSSRDPPLLALKRMIPDQDFQDILTKLNSCLLRKGDPSFYREVFQDTIDYEGFSATVIEVIENLRNLPSGLRKGVEGQILQVLLSGCVRRAYLRQGGFKRLLEEQMQVLGYYINTLQMADLLLSQPYFYILLGSMMSYLKQTVVSQFKINTYRMLIFLFDAGTPFYADLIEPTIRQFSLVNEDLERLKMFINVPRMERKVMTFMLDHLIPEEYIPRIQDRISRGDLKLSEAHGHRFTKLYTPTYLPQQITKDTLVAYFMDDNVLESLKDHHQAVMKMIEGATLKELAFYIYNFNSTHRVSRSELFEKVWLAFLNRISSKNIPQILSSHILGKYSHIEDKLYMPFLYKIMNFYAYNPSYYTRHMHANLLVHIKHRFRSVTHYPSELHGYVEGFRKFLQKQLSYLIPLNRFRHLLDLMQLGYALTIQEFRVVKQKIFEHDLCFYLLIYQENQLKQTIEQALLEYLKKRKIDLLPEAKIYIHHKYPSLKQHANRDYGVLTSGLKKMNEKQMAALSRLQKRYKGLQLKKNLVCLTNAQHLIAFHPSDKIVMIFLQKLYAVAAATLKLQPHIFDLSDLSQPEDFYTRIEALGIVSSRDEAYVQMEREESAEEKLQKQLKELEQQIERGAERYNSGRND